MSRPLHITLALQANAWWISHPRLARLCLALSLRLQSRPQVETLSQRPDWWKTHAEIRKRFEENL